MYELNYVQGHLKCPRSALIKVCMWWECRTEPGLEVGKEKMVSDTGLLATGEQGVKES